MRDVVAELAERSNRSLRVTNRWNWKLDKAEIRIDDDQLSAREDVAERNAVFADIVQVFYALTRNFLEFPAAENVTETRVPMLFHARGVIMKHNGFDDCLET